MPPIWFIILAFLALTVFFLAWRLIKSPTWKQIQLRKAAKLAVGGKTDDMIDFLKRNMNSKSVSDPLTNALVYFYIKAGQYDEAESIILQAIEKGDDSAMALAQLGYVAGGRKDHKKAEELYREALTCDDSLKSTMNMNIAGMLIELGERLDEAEELLKEALELREGSARSGIHVNLAMLYLKKKQPVDARVQAKTAFELIPSGSIILRSSRANALALASRACSMQGEKDEAIKLASKALKLIEDLPGMDRIGQELKHMVKDDSPSQAK
ncbi:MAG: tetratricopeptide repeat protein [Candidatus Aegiribacteria sp.]|nr:tetratricopeptide repeat protein [Candidatus Aegiribacteria sp.]